MFLIPSWYTNLLVLAVGLAVLDCRHFKTRIQEHVKKYGKSHIFKHLHLTATMFALHNSLSFKIIDKPSSKFDSKIKKLLHTDCRKPTLNTGQDHLAITFVIFCLFFVSFSSIIFIIYGNNYWQVLMS